MKSFPWKTLLCISVCVTTFSLVGCQAKSDVGGPVAPSDSATTDPNVHPTEGTHGGTLIELGNEAYHAELIHDDATGGVTVYMLDASASKAVPISATELVMNVSHDGGTEQYTLAANPEGTDPADKASRFTSSDPELAEELDHGHSSAQLVVTIDGKQFRGAVQHDHPPH